MAEELDLDKIADADEEEVAKSLERLKAQSAPPPPPEEAVSPIGENDTPEPKAEEKAPVAAKAEEPPAPPQQTDGKAWKLLRERERELADLRREMQEREAKQAAIVDPNRAPTYEDDPAEYLRQKTEAANTEIQRLRAEQQRRDELDGIRAAEQMFEKDHPDYYKATQHLIDSDLSEWDKSGIAASQVRAIRQNPQARQWLQQVSSQEDIRSQAERENRDPEEMAAYAISRQSWLQGRQRQLLDAAAATGRSVAAIAYDLAAMRGYRNEAAAPKANAEAEARARVERAKEISAAAESLSDVSSGEGAPQPKIIRNRNQILSLSDDELDAMIKSGSFRDL